MIEEAHAQDFAFDYGVRIADDVFINSGISPLNGIVLARAALLNEGYTDRRIRAILLESMYGTVEELNIRGIAELL